MYGSDLEPAEIVVSIVAHPLDVKLRLPTYDANFSLREIALVALKNLLIKLGKVFACNHSKNFLYD
jgi:hypothetical protein